MADLQWVGATVQAIPEGGIPPPVVLYDDAALQASSKKDANTEAELAQRRHARVTRKGVRREFLTRAKARGHKLGSNRWCCKRCKRDLRHVAEFACPGRA